MKFFYFLCFFMFSQNFLLASSGDFILDFELSNVWNTYNKVAIPKSTGTKFSLPDTVDLKTKVAPRLSLFYNITKRHTVGFIYAPLSIRGTGILENEISFNGETVPEKTEVNAKYRFNSYRFRYLYSLIKNDSTNFNLGFTAKIRDAGIYLNNTAKTNLGFVPLIFLGFSYKLYSYIIIESNLDAIISPQGRAEDFYIGFLLNPTNSFSFKVGYRLVEGGANVDKVYNFALLHYLVTGFKVDF